MKEMFRTRKLLKIMSVLLVVAIVAGSIWQSRDGVSVEASGMVSVDLSPGSSDNPEDANAPSLITEKGSNYYEIAYPVSGSKIEIGDVSGTGAFKPDLTVSAWDGESEFRLIALSSLEGKSQ
ncbi:MAG: hypothetical protein PHU23_02355, partial [Dehalococcoidales bacterium]|nr:hypothetical protein [Dehalococcoidales bacterium]